MGIAYIGGRRRGSERRMHFVRSTSELFIGCGLIGLGGGVLMGLIWRWPGGSTNRRGSGALVPRD